MNSLDFLAGPTGGLVYHVNALRFRKQYWKNFQQDVTQWLEQEWNPKEKELIVFGPSAGWTLSLNFIKRFAKVTCVEPDPTARALLRMRFRKTRFEMIDDPNLLPWFSKRENFESFLGERLNAAVLFSNLLGQLPLLWSTANVAHDRAIANRATFLQALETRNWASYHDVISAKAKLNSNTPRGHERAPELPTLAAEFFNEDAKVIDHETMWLSENRKTLFSTWEIRPGRNHVIGFIHT